MSVPGNYRPVSNLLFISKLLECIVNEQLLGHLVKHDLLPECQSAYRRCYSTETALLKVTSDALLASDRGMVTLLGMLDLSSAFDCVDHAILFARFEYTYGISYTALAWLKTYLTGVRSVSGTMIHFLACPRSSVGFLRARSWGHYFSSLTLRRSSIWLLGMASVYTGMLTIYKYTTAAWRKRSTCSMYS